MTQRTLSQNAALHLYCEMLADALNESGFEMKKVLEVKEVDVPWTKDSIKSVLWKPLQEALTGEESTTKLTTTEVNEVYEILSRHIAKNFGVDVEFPSLK